MFFPGAKVVVVGLVVVVVVVVVGYCLMSQQHANGSQGRIC